jgi:hypothetical protein
MAILIVFRSAQRVSDDVAAGEVMQAAWRASRPFCDSVSRQLTVR